MRIENFIMKANVLILNNEMVNICTRKGIVCITIEEYKELGKIEIMKRYKLQEIIEQTILFNVKF